MNSEPSVYSVRSIERVCDILDILRERPEGAPLVDIAEKTGLPKSSVFRYLAVLEARGYTQKSGALSTYRLSFPGLALDRPQPARLKEVARPFLEGLHARFGETLNLGLLDGRRVVFLDVLESSKAIRFAAQPGERGPIHSTALGKAMAADLDDVRVRQILTLEGMASYTPHTITEVEAYLTELARIRLRGYALDDGENDPDGRCVGVAIHGLSFPAAIGVSAPALRLPLDKTDEVASELLAAAAKIAEHMADHPR